MLLHSTRTSRQRCRLRTLRSTILDFDQAVRNAVDGELRQFVDAPIAELDEDGVGLIDPELVVLVSILACVQD